MESERDGHGEQEPRIGPRRHDQEAGVLGESVQRVEHLDGNKDREGESGGFDFTGAEVIAGV